MTKYPLALGRCPVGLRRRSQKVRPESRRPRVGRRKMAHDRLLRGALAARGSVGSRRRGLHGGPTSCPQASFPRDLSNTSTAARRISTSRPRRTRSRTRRSSTTTLRGITARRSATTASAVEVRSETGRRKGWTRDHRDPLTPKWALVLLRSTLGSSLRVWFPIDSCANSPATLCVRCAVRRSEAQGARVRRRSRTVADVFGYRRDRLPDKGACQRCSRPSPRVASRPER
jgi:hypothetical protein